MRADELRALRSRWVAGAFPTMGKTQAQAALVIDELIEECFALRKALEGMIRVYEAHFEPLSDDQQPKGAYTQARAALGLGKI